MAVGRNILLAACLASAAGCANLNTIDRTTTTTNGVVTAVHLDAQQRTVLTNSSGIVCAEPSPDALAAYAAAASLSGGRPEVGSAAASFGGNSTAGSIGLRTQSITLMRDALYRVCEMQMNGKLSASQAAALLSRSQDLTAVVLAVEQLTGPVSAAQAALSGSATSSASASVASNAKTLEALNEQKADLAAAKAAAEKRKGETEATVTAEMEAANPDKSEEEIKALVAGDQRVKDAEAEITALTESEATLQKTIDKVSAAQDSALANTLASSSGSATISGGKPGGEHSTSAGIASAVTAILTTALNKSYAVDQCMSMLSSGDGKFKHLTNFCSQLVRDVTLAQVEQANKVAAAAVGAAAVERAPKASTTNSTQCLKGWLRDPEEKKEAVRKIDNVRARAGAPSLLSFLDYPRFEKIRVALIADAAVDCSKYGGN